MEETKDSPDPLVLTKPDVKRLFELSGVPEEKLETFDQTFEAAAGEKASLLATNIAGGKNSILKRLMLSSRSILNGRI